MMEKINLRTKFYINHISVSWTSELLFGYASLRCNEDEVEITLREEEVKLLIPVLDKFLIDKMEGRNNQT